MDLGQAMTWVMDNADQGHYQSSRYPYISYNKYINYSQQMVINYQKLKKFIYRYFIVFLALMFQNLFIFIILDERLFKYKRAWVYLNNLKFTCSYLLMSLYTHNIKYLFLVLLLLPLSTWSAPATTTYPYNITHGQLNIVSLSNTTFTVSYPYAFPTTPQGFVAIAGMEIISNLLIDFEWNFQHLTSTSFNIVYTSYNSTYTLSKVSLNYLIFVTESYGGTYSSMGVSYAAFTYINVNTNPTGFSTASNGSSIRSLNIPKSNFYSKYQSVCFLFFRGMKISANNISSLYDLNMTCTDTGINFYIRLYVGSNTKILGFKASLFAYDRYELQINKNMAFDFGMVQYTNGTTSSFINPSSDYAVIFGLSGFTFQTTSIQFNLGNYLTYNLSSPSPSYYRLNYVIFTFLSCPVGTVVNRVARTCDAPLCSQQFQQFSPLVVSGVSLYDIQTYKSSTVFLIYSNRLDIYKYDDMIWAYLFSYRLEFLSSLSSIYSFGFTTDYSRLAVADNNQNIAIYAWNGNAYVFQNLIFADSQNTKNIVNIRISDDGLTLFIDYVSTSSIYTFNTYIYNTLTNKYEYGTNYNRFSWNGVQLQSFIMINKQNKTSIYSVAGNYYQYLKQLSVTNLYQSASKIRLDPTTNLKVKSFCSLDRSLIVTSFINPNSYENYGIGIYQRDPVTLVHSQIQFIRNLYGIFKYVAIDKQGLTLLVSLQSNMHFLVYKRASTTSTFSLFDIINGAQATVIQYVVSLSEDASVKFTTEGNSIKVYYCPASMPSVTSIPIPASIYVNQASSSSSSNSSSNSSSPSSTSGVNSSQNNQSSSKTENILQLASIVILAIIVLALLAYILISNKLANKTVYSDAKNNLQEGRNEKNDITLESIENSVVNIEMDNMKIKKIRKSRATELESIHVDSISMIE